MLEFPPLSPTAEDAETPRAFRFPLDFPKLSIGVSTLAIRREVVLLAISVRNRRGVWCCWRGVVLVVGKINTLRDGMLTKERDLLEPSKAREEKDTMYRVPLLRGDTSTYSTERRL